jgi:hypothetical protein
MRERHDTGRFSRRTTMSKRKIAILIGAALLGTQAFAAAAQGTFPPSTDDIVLLPVQEAYFAARMGASPNPAGASGMVFPSSTDDIVLVPALEQHFSRRLAADPSPTGAASTALSAGDYWNWPL